MTSSRATVWAILAGAGLVACPPVSSAQPNREAAVDAYNRATRMEREGLEEFHRGGSQDLLRRYQADCTIPARQSYALMPSKLAAWRVVSCASGAGYWLLARLAVEAFSELEPAGIERWTHPSFDEEETERVRYGAQQAAHWTGYVILWPSRPR